MEKHRLDMKDIKSIIALNGAVFLLMFGVGMIVARLPDKILRLSGSVTQVGALAATFAISYILFQIPCRPRSSNSADRQTSCRGSAKAVLPLCIILKSLKYKKTTVKDQLDESFNG